MINLIYYNDYIRVYRNGNVERLFKNKGWQIVENVANNSYGYNRIRIDKKIILRHRLVAFCFLGIANIVGKSGGDCIDHINGDKLNNAVSNLREVTNQQNRQNTNSKCYSFKKQCKKFEVRIYIDGKEKSFGYFKIEADAKQKAQELKILHYPNYTPRA